MNKWSVYIHINKNNKKIYVGITSKTPEKRWGKNGIHYMRQNFGKAIRKYGIESFIIEELETNILSQEEANQREIYYIALYKLGIKNELLLKAITEYDSDFIIHLFRPKLKGPNGPFFVFDFSVYDHLE